MLLRLEYVSTKSFLLDGCCKLGDSVIKYRAGTTGIPGSAI